MEACTGRDCELTPLPEASSVAATIEAMDLKKYVI
jgi:hypothetical protein